MLEQQLDPEIQRSWQQFIEKAELPEWIREMHQHYRRTGKYRQEDLRRLLGDPNQAVEIGPNASLATGLCQRKNPV